MMKKMAVLVAVTVLLLAGCGKNKVDESTVEAHIKRSKEAVTLLNEENFDELRAMFDETMKDALTVEQLQQTVDVLKESGEFSSFGDASVSKRESYFVVILPAEYTKDKRVYEITFDDQQRLAALYVK
ncbi:DUF3887 domain-containing protein [Sporosarcina cascadiensis]|uniref:DUF3887 domain-containing protein n=1 Tax=Sporosarcina cascadiensis TaxID=2660747 RepID=UPI00129B7449|nr:DUF3887 domain-containing protein [Sporosarcina cascadiensis]